jgi:hypothetical protein
MFEIPEHLLQRSAEARAAAEGRDVAEVLARMKGEAPQAAAPPPAPAEPADAAVAAPPPAAETPPAPAAAPPATPKAAPSGLPEHLLRRSAEARAAAEGGDVEEILAEMKGEAAPTPAAPAAAPVAAEPPPAPAAPAKAAPSALPDHILRRSAEARAKKEGRDVEEVLAEMKGEAAPTPAAPATAPAAAAKSAPAGLPDAILRRSAQARAKKEGRDVEEVLAEMKGEAAPTPVPVAAGGGAAPAAAAVAAPAAAPVIPEGVSTQRLLTVVKAGAIQKVKKEPHDKVATWPHLLIIEFVALIACTVALIVFSAFVDAPLLEFANFNEQPNPSKAPWYFLGLQELLAYFDPQVAGVIIPGFGLVGLAMIPYVDRNPAVRPSDRKLAIMIFSFFVFAAAILTIYGSFFRGPGFNFTFPWSDGIFFDF